MSDREIMDSKYGKTGLGVRLIPEEEPELTTDKYVQSVKEKFEERSQTGIRKYNTTLERDDLDFVDWLTHLQEELMDATLYVERLKTSYAEKDLPRK